MAKAKNSVVDVTSLPFKEREIKLMEMVNEAIKTCGVGVRPQLTFTKDGLLPVIASVDLLEKKEDVKEGVQSAPVRPETV